MKSQNKLSIFFALLLVSCANVPAQVSTKTVAPTPTYLPTITPKPTSTRTPYPTQIPTLLPTPTFAPVLPQRGDNDKVSGTYKLDRDGSEICVLKVVLEPFLPPNKEISFEIFCKHGPPSYNSGHAMAKIVLVENRATYSPAKLISGAACQIEFQFEKNIVRVTQSGKDYACGFGQGIHSDGVYSLISRKPSVLGCMNDENPCGLSNPIP